MIETLRNAWQYWLPVVAFVVAASASTHVILRKRDVRAAIGWVGLIWLVPLAGSLLYALLGVNRIRRRAQEMRRGRPRIVSQTAEFEVADMVASANGQLEGLARLSAQVSGRPLLGGNRLEPLKNGDEAYPAMLAAIQEARRSITLATYIFGVDRAGAPIVDALADAVRRGVQVRVLIDGVGSWYTTPRAHDVLRKAGVRAVRFQPHIAHAGLAFFNLRNHRKTLIVDGAVAFAGGMNIHEYNVHALSLRRAVRDVHFRIEGPVVRQLQDAFAEDWAYITGELLDGDIWYPALATRGTTVSRVLTDGPDGDLEVVRSVLMGALAAARRSARIVTPYFIPDAAMIAALRVAALRGVAVDIVLPSHVNIPPAQWASTAQLWQVLETGCRVHLSPRPFDHAKLFVVDDAWVLIGSTNWDPRSLRLNFELDIESHDPEFASVIAALVAERIAESTPYTLADADGRPFPIRIRDGVARLFSPYL